MVTYKFSGEAVMDVFRPIIVMPFDDHIKLFFRTSNLYVTAKPEMYDMLRKLMSEEAATPDWLANIAMTYWGIDISGLDLQEVMILRDKTSYSYGVASWEINLLCNYHCPHCYLGVRPNESLSVEKRITILGRMCDLGVFKLQVTGGEPLIDRHFVETYEAAYDRGIMLSISTNGSWLRKPSILSTLQWRPPLRVTVSLYGATQESYEAMTATQRGTFDRFIEGLEALKGADINLRINIIVSKFNQHERDAMIQIASRFTDDYYVYDSMSATIHGSNSPTTMQADEEMRQHRIRESFTSCDAGVSSFHVDPLGHASMCKVSREPWVRLDADPLTDMSLLATASRQQLERTGKCAGCAIAKSCTTCPVIVTSYRSAKADPSFYCNLTQMRM